MLGTLLSLLASLIMTTQDAAEEVQAETPQVVAVETDKGVIWTCVVDGVKLQTGDVLPEGYPPPTAPGVIEVKDMPAVRRAEVSGLGSARRGMSTSFNPLFRHISSRGIAMTAPVEVDIREMSTEEPEGEAFTAAFLYRSEDLGPVGDAEDGVRVVDIPEMTVVAIGIRGAYLSKHWSEPLEELESWIDEHSEEWRVVGDPRFCGYNAPFMPVWRMWSEIQIPIARISSGDANPEAQASSVESGS